MKYISPFLYLFVVFHRAVFLHADESVVSYNRDVLPILADHCFHCHGFDQGSRKAGLRLDQSEAATKTLRSGSKAIVPGDPKASGLVNRIHSIDDDRMPPAKTGKTLSEKQKTTLEHWIGQGARYEPHWAYIKPIKTQPPVVEGASNAIDGFIRFRLGNEGIQPSPIADRPTLIRRISLDLTGLPPTMLEVNAFVNDPRPDALEHVVERLLQSEHFGERWARWWLDLAHYADSDGYLQDFIRPVAWRWRQWVVDAFNHDIPFDQFTIEQIAGDLLPNATISQRMGTGFFRNTLSNREGGAELEEYRVNQVVDRTVTLGTTWLALTTGCAQCHDHKFDAISQVEFYKLYAFFNQSDEVNFDAPLPEESCEWELARLGFHQKRAEILAPVAVELAALQADWEKRLLHAESHPDEDFAWDRLLELLGLQWGQNLGEGQLEGINIIKMPVSIRSQDQKERLLDYFLKSASSAYAQKWKELKLSEIKAKLDSLSKTIPPVTRAPGLMSFPQKRTTHLHVRGDFRRKGPVVEPGVPSVLPPLEGPGNRLSLARWLVHRGHPLTSRVVVNRIWQELFGKGIVATSDNFGIRGERPTHPELLDWLAVDFMERGWSIKSILRQMVLSKTYQQSSAFRDDLAERDPQNNLVARQQRIRISAEAIRDSSLAVSGLLNQRIGGPSVKPPQPASVSMDGYKNEWVVSKGTDRHRRGLYTWLQRTSPFAQSVAFDLPDTSRSCTIRARSNTPLQSLNLLNDPVFIEAAAAFAGRIQRECSMGEPSRIRYAFQLALSRLPRPAEEKRLLEYLAAQREIFKSPKEQPRLILQASMENVEPAWVMLASVLLNLDEFINRE